MASDSRAPRKPPADESVDSSTSSTQPWRPKANPWLIAVVVAMAAFMEVLDTSIANVALPYMAGNLGASNDESTWILTSYLVSNAIVLPISGWFASVLGRKRFFLLCLVIFTISSLLCGIGPSLGAMILFRGRQGAGVGGLQPVAQSILADTFPPQQRGLAFALYGITTIIAPTVGPTLGGWITDNYTWRWIFFINLPVGILTLFLVLRLVEDPPWMKRLTGAAVKIDYIGVALLTLGVGALQVMLDKGQEDDWFGSHFILTLAVLAAVGLVSLVMWECFQKHEFSWGERDDVYPRHHAVLQLGYDASVPANPDGLYGGVCRSGTLGWRACPSLPHACRRRARGQVPGTLHHRVWLVGVVAGNVLFDAASRLGHQLLDSQLSAGGAGFWACFPFRAH